MRTRRFRGDGLKIQLPSQGGPNRVSNHLPKRALESELLGIAPCCAGESTPTTSGGTTSAGNLIDRAGARPLLERLHISERHLNRVEKGFEQLGGWVNLFARFFDEPTGSTPGSRRPLWLGWRCSPCCCGEGPGE
jgi:hypothetical protein